MSDLFQHSSAIISDDKCYRYELRRWWGPGSQALFIGLNPSTADAMEDDPTIRRCCGFAKAWGFDGIVMVNLYAYRATDPRELLAQAYPVGPDNDRHVIHAIAATELHIACWGKPGGPRGARKDDRCGGSVPMLDVLRGRPLHCLGRNKDGSPKHPLYLRADTKFEPLTTITKSEVPR